MDGFALEKLFAGGFLRVASLAGRVRGLGLREKRCVKCLFRVVDSRCLQPARRANRKKEGLVFMVVVFLCAESDEQADVGDFASAVVVAGLLAVGKSESGE